MSALKKRKTGAGTVTVTLTDECPAQATPLLGLFPASTPKPETTFAPYYSFEKNETMLVAREPAAEGGEVVWESRGAVESNAQYAVGMYNPRTGLLALHPTPVPVHNFSVVLPSSSSSANELGTFATQRALLGSTFGTRKAIRSINAAQRARLDATSFGSSSAASMGVSERASAAIARNATSLPAQSVLDAAAAAARPTATPNENAESVDKVYDFELFAPEAEQQALLKAMMHDLMRAKGAAERSKFLPDSGTTQWVYRALNKVLPRPVPVAEGEEEVEQPPLEPLGAKAKKGLGRILLVASLFAFRKAAGGKSSISRSELKGKLSRIPAGVVDGMWERYVSLKGGPSSPVKGSRGGEGVMTSDQQIRLICDVCLLVLKVDNWSTDVTNIAGDFKIGVKKVEKYFQMLGCKLTALPVADVENLTKQGVGQAELKGRKRAVLQLPLVFPKERSFHGRK